jgi:hypothetical protein
MCQVHPCRRSRYKILPVFCRYSIHPCIPLFESHFVRSNLTPSNLSGHQQQTLMLKIVPDDFSQPLFRTPVLHPFGASLRLFKIDPVNFVSHFSGKTIRLISNAIKNRYASSQRVRSIPVLCLQVKYFKQILFQLVLLLCVRKFLHDVQLLL